MVGSWYGMGQRSRIGGAEAIVGQRKRVWRCWTWRSGPGELTDKGRGHRHRGDLDNKKMRFSGCNRRSIGCSVSIALQKKMLATQEVRSCRWTMEGYHRQRKGSRSRRRWVHCECQSLEDVGCDQRREWAIAAVGSGGDSGGRVAAAIAIEEEEGSSDKQSNRGGAEGGVARCDC
ncbi:hypothetical protein B296_00047183 [Ensete ventricosum]|uniref:Uncharacterized protein n=1 Tax=Ensete ventricosum TaxID=4639 RepID=A0A426Z0R8_ENSVE|nr:hypothetical protein B296_00047183 [Ensete ventricosum]